jgi:phenylalanyl-tRNA synthetase alpha chain
MSSDRIKQALAEIDSFVPSNLAELEEFKIKFLGKKGLLGELFAAMKDIAAEEKKAYGLLVNEVKDKAEAKYKEAFEKFENATSSVESDLDLTLPGEPVSLGARHPISIVRNTIINIFSRIGYTIAEGPEIEDDWHNFSALNFPPEHPARDMQDTFFLEKDPCVHILQVCR